MLRGEAASASVAWWQERLSDQCVYCFLTEEWFIPIISICMTVTVTIGVIVIIVITVTLLLRRNLSSIVQSIAKKS